MENEEMVIEDSENWFVSLRGNKLFAKHKVKEEKQYGMYSTVYLGAGVDINSRQFKSSVELLKAIVLSNEETLEEK